MGQVPEQFPRQFVDTASAYSNQNLAMMGQISNMLQANAYLLGTQFKPNSTYSLPLPYQSPNMFGQMTDVFSAVAGPEAGAIAQMVIPMLKSPELAPYLGPIPGAITAMQNSMPIGGGADAGAFLYSQLQKRLGASILKPPPLPSLMSNQQEIDKFNEHMLQMQAFTGNPAPVEQLMSFDPSLGAAETGYGFGVQLANIEKLRNSSRFKDTFSLYEAAVGGPSVSSDPELKKLIELAQKGTPESAVEANKLLTPDLKATVQQVIKNAEGATNFVNTSGMMAKMAPQLIQALGLSSDSPAGQALLDAIMDITGVSKDSSTFSQAAIQSLSMMGSLGTTISGQDAMGRPIMAADRITSGIVSRIESASSPFSGIRGMGMLRAGQMMNELAKSGVLTSGGVDTFGAVTPEDVKKLEESISIQLEGFSEVAAAGKRIGMQISEITQSMQKIFKGQFGRALDDSAGRIFQDLAAQAGPGPMDDQTRVFLEAQAQRKAGTSMMQQVEAAIHLGKFASLGPRESMAVLETSSQLAESLGLSGGVGIELGSAAIARVGLSQRMQRPMTLEQSLAQQMDIAAKAKINPSTRAFLSLKAAISDGVLSANDPDVKQLLDDVDQGKNISPETVAELISKTGAKVSAYVSPEGIERGMSVTGAMTSVSDFFARSEDVNLLGTLKREFESVNTNPESLTKKMTGGAAAELAKAFGMEESQVAQMNFHEFAVRFNDMKDQSSRAALLESLVNSGVIERTERGQILSILGNSMDRFGLAADRGPQRTATVRLKEELDIEKYGATSMVLQAQAVTENQNAINSTLRSSKGNLQQNVSSALGAIRRAKIDKLKAGSPGMSDDAAAAAVEETGFTFGEIVEAASGTSSVELEEALNTRAQTLEGELKKLEALSSPNQKQKRETEVVKRALADIRGIQAVRAATTEDEKKKLMEEIKARTSPPSSTVTAATATAATEEQQKKRAEVEKRVQDYMKSRGVTEAEARVNVELEYEREARQLIAPTSAASVASSPAVPELLARPVEGTEKTPVGEAPVARSSDSFVDARPVKADEVNKAIVMMSSVLDDVKKLLVKLVASSQRGADAGQAMADATQ